MNNDCAGATEKRQMQQSVTLAFPFALYDAAATEALFSAGASPRSSVSCLSAFLLSVSTTSPEQTHLNSDAPRCCHSRPTSTRILTQRYISSAPPW